MSSAKAIQTLEHASEYIFATRISSGRRKMMRNAALWEAMAMLHQCRYRVEGDLEPGQSVEGYRMHVPAQTLRCTLNA